MSKENGHIGLGAALVLLSCDATGTPVQAVAAPRLTIDAIPGVPEALELVGRLKDWRIHEPTSDRRTSQSTSRGKPGPSSLRSAGTNTARGLRPVRT